MKKLFDQLKHMTWVEFGRGFLKLIFILFILVPRFCAVVKVRRGGMVKTRGNVPRCLAPCSPTNPCI